MATPTHPAVLRRSRWAYVGALGGGLGAFAWPAMVMVLFYVGFGGLSRGHPSEIERWADSTTPIFLILGSSLVLFPLGALGLRNPAARLDRVLVAGIALGLGALLAALVFAIDRPTQCVFGTCYRVLGPAGSWAIYGVLGLGALTNILTGIAIETSAQPGGPGRGPRIVRTILVASGGIVLLAPAGLLFALIAAGGTVAVAVGDVAATILFLRQPRSS